MFHATASRKENDHGKRKTTGVSCAKAILEEGFFQKLVGLSHVPACVYHDSGIALHPHGRNSDGL